jgi:hypothetical protein
MWSSLVKIAYTEKTTDLSQVTDKLHHIMLYTSPWSRFELTISVVIGTDCIGNCKSNYHTITTSLGLLNISLNYSFHHNWADISVVMVTSTILFLLSQIVLGFYWKKWFYIWYMALALLLVPCLLFPGLPHIYFLFTMQLTNERVGVFLARRPPLYEWGYNIKLGISDSTIKQWMSNKTCDKEFTAKKRWNQSKGFKISSLGLLNISLNYSFDQLMCSE